MSLPISLILKDLETAPKSIIPILSSLHRESARLSQISKVDLKHLTSRTLNLCKNHQAYQVWCGVNVIYVLIDNSEILSSYGSQFFAQLQKILQGGKLDSKVFKSTVECLNKLCSRIRGKPTLTREILTPNLSNLISVYLENVSDEPFLMSSSLQVLVQHHPTTSRPFANKIKAKLLEIIASENFLTYPDVVKQSVAGLLATLPIVEKDGPEQFWQKDVQRILCNIGGTMKIFESFLDLREDEDASKLLQRFSDADEEIFGLLHIDVNHPTTLLTISSRIELLLILLEAYVTTATQYSVNVPIGKIIAVAELICSVNTKFISFKREIRDAEIKEMVELALFKSQHASVQVLAKLPEKYSGHLLPHLNSILSFLELIIFMSGKRLDRNRIIAEEVFACDLLGCVSAYLALTGSFPDHSLLTRFIELALILVEPRDDLNVQAKETDSNLSKHSKAARKRAKKNGSTPLADILSHEHLFTQAIPQSTRKIVFSFFTTIIPRVTIAPTQYNKLIKLVMVEAVKYKDQSIGDAVPKELKDILIAVILTPAPESASILPIASTLMWDSDILTVFNNPRFPQLPAIVKAVESVLEDEDAEEEESKESELQTEELSDEPQSKKRKLDDAQEEEKSETPEFREKVNPTHIFSKESARESFEADVPVKPIVETAKEETVVEQVVATVEESSDDEAGSELEIPDLDLSDDSDNEN